MVASTFREFTVETMTMNGEYLYFYSHTDCVGLRYIAKPPTETIPYAVVAKELIRGGKRKQNRKKILLFLHWFITSRSTDLLPPVVAALEAVVAVVEAGGGHWLHSRKCDSGGDCERTKWETRKHQQQRQVSCRRNSLFSFTSSFSTLSWSIW